MQNNGENGERYRECDLLVAYWCCLHDGVDRNIEQVRNNDAHGSCFSVSSVPIAFGVNPGDLGSDCTKFLTKSGNLS